MDAVGIISMILPTILVLCIVVDLVATRVFKLHKRKCMDCKHRISERGGDPEYAKCAKTMTDKTRYDSVVGKDVRKIDFSYCSTVRRSGSWTALCVGTIMQGKPYCSKAGWFWERKTPDVD